MEPSLSVLRRQLDEKKRVERNIHNLALTMFKPGTRIEYASRDRSYFGVVVEVVGDAGRTQIRVRNLLTNKERDIWLSDVTGLVKEN